MTSLPIPAPDPIMPPDLAASRALAWETPKGRLHIETHASEDRILDLAIAPDFGALFRLSRYREEFLHVARHPGGNVILAVADPGVIVGYILVERPVPVAWQRRVAHNRWTGCPAVVELGAIEVSPSYRRLGVAEHMLEALVEAPEAQGQIIIGLMMRRYWDLPGTGLDAWRYRAALMDLLVRYGFQEYATDDPRIITEPANALMARIGPDVAAEQIEQFHRLRLAHASSEF